MAINESRSMNADLHAGMTDGAWKKLDSNRGGVVEPVNPARKHSLPTYMYATDYLPDPPLDPVPFVKMRDGGP